MKMKKVLIGLAVLAISMSSFAGNITWACADLGIGYTAGWKIALYEDVDKDGFDATIINSDGTTDSDDVFLSITTSLVVGKAGSYWGDAFAAPSGSMTFNDRLYSVVFNAAAIADATQYQVTTMTTQGNSWYQLPSTDIDNTYTTTSVSSWQAVPEPATAMLLALGGGLAWLVRLKQRLS
jgi:hypothetical protein